MYNKIIAYIIAFMLCLTFSACDDEMDFISTCPIVVHSDSRYQNSINDPSTALKDVWIDNNCLNLRLTYSGGCSDHHIDLISPSLKNFNASSNSKNEMMLEVYHVNEDPCQGIVTQEFGFDISQFRAFANEWRFSFSDSDKVIDVKF